MKFYTKQHPFYCGVDLHADAMSVCILDASGEVVVHKNIPTKPKTFLKLINPYRAGLIVGCECMFTLVWVAALVGPPLSGRRRLNAAKNHGVCFCGRMAFLDNGLVVCRVVPILGCLGGVELKHHRPRPVPLTFQNLGVVIDNNDPAPCLADRLHDFFHVALIAPLIVNLLGKKCVTLGHKYLPFLGVEIKWPVRNHALIQTYQICH